MKTLIVAPAWVGDMVMAQPLVAMLAGPDSDPVDLVAPPATAPLGERMPGVNRTWTLAAGHGELALGRRRALARQVRAAGYERAIVLPNSFKSALVPFLAGIPLRTGWTGEMRLGVLNDRRRLDPQRYPLQVERFLALGLPAGATLPSPLPVPQLRADPDRARALADRMGLETGPITVLCPGAEFGPAKRWPIEHFAAVARQQVAAGRKVWLVGSPGDRPACAEIESRSGAGVHNLAGRTSLVDAVDLLSLAQRVVCNDSGLMHVAAALERPVLALFGSTSPEFTPPLGSTARVLRHPVPCSPCFQRECPLGHLDCLVKLEPEQVIAEL